MASKDFFIQKPKQLLVNDSVLRQFKLFKDKEMAAN